MVSRGLLYRNFVLGSILRLASLAQDKSFDYAWDNNPSILSELVLSEIEGVEVLRMRAQKSRLR